MSPSTPHLAAVLERPLPSGGHLATGYEIPYVSEAGGAAALRPDAGTALNESPATAMLHPDLLVRLSQARRRLRRPDVPPPSVRQVAAEIGMSPYHFIRLFKAVFGETPAQCRIAARMEQARRLLAETDQAVTEICMAVGYASLGTFSDVFRRRVGVAPSVYRRRAREMQQAAGTSRRPAGCFGLMCGAPV